MPQNGWNIFQKRTPYEYLGFYKKPKNPKHSDENVSRVFDVSPSIALAESTRARKKRDFCRDDVNDDVNDERERASSSLAFFS